MLSRRPAAVTITTAYALAGMARLTHPAERTIAHTGAAPIAPPMAARVSPDGRQVAFIVGDSIFVSILGDQRVRALAGGVQFEAQAARKQLVWSPDSRSLLFRRGTPPRMTYAVVDLSTSAVTDILPDTLAGRLRTVGNIFTGPPVWAPTSDRIAFLGGRPDELRAVHVVYVATRRGGDGWSLRAVASDPAEKAALAWGHRFLAWTSRERNGATSLTIAPVSGGSVGAGTAVATGSGRITGLMPSPSGDVLRGSLRRRA